MANRKLGKLRNLGNLGKVIPSFLVSEFSILPYSQNRKLGFKNLGKKIPRFPRFPSFRPGPFKMLGLTFSSKLDWGSYIISIAKIASKKIGALIFSMNFLSPEFAVYLYKSIICPNMEYCCHVWAGSPSCYLELLDKLQKRICRTVGPLLAASLEPLTQRRNVASLSLFYRYYFGRWSSELTQLVPLLYSPGRSAHFSDRLHEFSVTIPRFYKDVYVNSFFPCTARLWNSSPILFLHL